ncbi:hypothetical protein SLEP1_g11191 [Rubroshorea leprosula]|uniref:Uncharacterized protein n=1 Tax=Rubroshorea leprosula TaxID=152421 RepID=A0AAV5ILB6_9ROSI|nr:hypothetical protein SLEP1_g11191 [Rubroshorea leprosula]
MRSESGSQRPAHLGTIDPAPEVAEYFIVLILLNNLWGEGNEASQDGKWVHRGPSPIFLPLEEILFHSEYSTNSLQHHPSATG